MPRPGTTVQVRDIAPPRSAPTDTAVWFVVGTAPDGPTDATPISSLDGFRALYGERDGTDADLYDALEAFFRDGGSRAYVARIDAADPAAGDYGDALDLFPAELGPGQVSAPGQTDAGIHAVIIAHANTTGRVPLLDAPDAPAVATLTTLAGTDADVAGARTAAAFAPWGIAPGIAPGTTRTIAPSATVAGLIARGDATGSPNQPAAGARGESRFLVGVTQVYTDAERETLNDAGINVIRPVYGGIRLYGYRTLADPDTAPAWVELGHARLFMAIRARAQEIAERYVFAEIDGRGLKLAQFAGDLAGMLIPYYDAGSLYGATPGEAFRVDVGPQVNTPETIANRELRAIISVRVSHFAELVALEISSVPTTEVIA